MLLISVRTPTIFLLLGHQRGVILFHEGSPPGTPPGTGVGVYLHKITVHILCDSHAKREVFRILRVQSNHLSFLSGKMRLSARKLVRGLSTNFPLDRDNFDAVWVSKASRNSRRALVLLHFCQNSTHPPPPSTIISQCGTRWVAGKVSSEPFSGKVWT